MEIRKQQTSTPCGIPSPSDLEAIHAFCKHPIPPEELYTFAIRLCDNEIDRDGERFDLPALQALQSLFIGKTGLFDHQWASDGQTARIYRTELCQEEGVKTSLGEPYCYLKGYAYLLRLDKNADLIAEIEAGIKKEVSIGCSIAKCTCSICGEPFSSCSHQKGMVYQGKRCHAILQEPTDAYEWSFVAVPAQKHAGILKQFGSISLQKFVAQCGDASLQEELSVLQKHASLGRSYLDRLKQEVCRLASLCGEPAVWGRLVEQMEEPDLLDCYTKLNARLNTLYPLPTQLKHSERLPDSQGAELFRV